MNLDEYEGENKSHIKNYSPADELSEKAEGYGHGSSDFYTMYNFIEKIRGNTEADVIDVYEALDMFLPGMFAYRSVLQGGVTLDIPNIRDKHIREYYRHDTMCTDAKVAKEQLIPSYSKGNPHVPQELYDLIKQKFIEEEKQKK